MDQTSLPLSGERIVDVSPTQICRLTLSNRYQLDIEVPFDITEDDLVVTRFDPVMPGTLQTAYLLGAKVVDAVVARGGTLQLKFASNVRLMVEPSSDYEAWNIVGPDGFRVVSTPGGDLATWP